MSTRKKMTIKLQQTPSDSDPFAERFKDMFNDEEGLYKKKTKKKIDEQGDGDEEYDEEEGEGDEIEFMSQ
jgi:hypothetical protein